MPSKKIIVIFIICFSITVSFWLIFKKDISKEVNFKQENVSSVDAVNTIDIKVADNNDWKKILTSVNTKSTGLPSLSKESSDIVDNNMTSDLAIDIFSKYLSEAKGDKNISTEDAEKIAFDVLNSPNYSISRADDLYVIGNLNIDDDSSPLALQKYKNNINYLFSLQINKLSDSRNIGDIIYESYIKDKVVKTKELEKFITASESVKKGLVTMAVPKPLSSPHLNLLNSVNNLQNDLEAIYNYPDDPVRGFLGINKYQADYNEFLMNFKKINDYFISNL